MGIPKRVQDLVAVYSLLTWCHVQLDPGVDPMQFQCNCIATIHPETKANQKPVQWIDCMENPQESTALDRFSPTKNSRFSSQGTP